ncbi:septal ring lytic transglycosylase RlpA family protein [Neosynechococcus sphagnicola]|uniref:septal ring lytic transglycosylase RlpA family protein n=1 Tax=Neosynechococcus sphagnicola TaxID=1501145 RepID=UPI001EF9EAB1|nr:septal ring lytic transglycosylase RlpA family protein [Neosynechococcus sphagnicola]
MLNPCSWYQILGGMMLVTATLGMPQLGQAEPLQGLASWYGSGFGGGYTASGEPFNAKALTAAHRSLPFGTQVRVTNLDNGRSVIVTINDRLGHGGRVIDLSAGAAYALDMVRAGIAQVRLDVLGR